MRIGMGYDVHKLVEGRDLIVISPDGKVVKASNDAKEIVRMW